MSGLTGTWINMLQLLCLKLLLLLLLWIPAVLSERLTPKPTYLITAPKVIQPGETVGVYVSVFELRYTVLTVTASISRVGDREYATAHQEFTTASTTILLLQIPQNAVAGNYTLTVSGRVGNSNAGYLFYNETAVTFDPKQVSVFIQPDRVLIGRKDKVWFRVIALTPDLMPVKQGSVTIFIKDPFGRIMRRFLAQIINNGYYENEMSIPHPLVYGWWTIEVQGWGHTYSEKFYVYNMWSNKIWVNATMPSYVFENEYGIEGTIISNYTKGYAFTGNVSIDMEIDSGYPREPVHVKQTITEMKGVTSFLTPMSDIVEALGDKHLLPEANIKTTVSVYDWYAMESRTAVMKTQVLFSRVRVRFLGGSVRVFKPLQPIPIVVAFHMEDGSPYRNQNHRLAHIMMTVQNSVGQTYYTEFKKPIPDDAVLRTEYIPQGDDHIINIRVIIDGLTPSDDLKLIRHKTRHKNYLQVVSSTRNPKVDHYMVFTVRSSVYIPVIYYMVMAKSNILFQNTLNMTSRQKTFSIALSRAMIPEAKILVYGLHNGEEVLSDSLQFHVKGIRKDFDVQVNRGKDLHRDTVEINGSGDEGSFVAFSAAQYELYRRGVHNMFTEYKIEEELATYEGSSSTSFKHMFYNEENKPEPVYYTAPSQGVDPNTTFHMLGLHVFTDADLFSFTENSPCNSSLGYMTCYDGTCYHEEQRCDGMQQCWYGYDELGCPDWEPYFTRPDEVASMAFDQTTFDRPDWAWKTFFTKPEGRIDARMDLPFRPRTWVVSGFTLSHTEGFAFSEIPARVDTTRSFYIELEHDSKARKGEQLGMQVTVFNYWHQSVEAIITLHGSDQYRFINVEQFGIVRSYDPRTTAGDVQTMVYLEAGEVKLIHLPVLPIVGGKVKVTVTGECMLGSYTATHTVTVSMDGITNTYHTPYLIDLVNKGSVLIPDLDIAVPERFVVPEQREHLYVPGSQKATVSVVGDIFGPGYFTSYPDYYNVFNHNQGPVTDHLFTFGFNALQLKYLKITNQLSDSRQKSVLTQMAKTFLLITSFIKENGGGANYKSKTDPDPVTSAYFLEIMSEAVEQDWVYDLYIDGGIIDGLIKFVVSYVDPQTGAVITNTTRHDVRFQNGSTDSAGNPLHIAETALCVIGLRKALILARGSAASDANMAISLSCDYLASHLNDITDPYEMCLVTYALYAANRREQTDAFTLMRNMRRQDEYVYWSSEEIPRNPVKIINTRPYQQPREMPVPVSSRAVQATSYALMVYLRNNMLWEAQPIMMWLQTQRDTDSSFIGPLDTITATQALLEYAKYDTNRALYNMQVNLQATSSPDWSQTVSLESRNLATYTQHSVPEVFGSVRSSASGTGMALLQLTTKVNVEHPHQIRQPESPAFEVNVQEIEFWGRNHSHFKMDICAKWLRTDIAPTSSNAFLRVEYPTGFFVRKEVLRAALKTGRLRGKRSRPAKDYFTIYFDYIDSIGDCWSFTAERQFPVANVSIQHEIMVMDISEPGLQTRTLYTTYGLFHLNICQTCGSFECPYCPFYNP